MSFQTLDELRRVLVDLELVSSQQLGIAIEEVGGITRQPGPLLEALERQGALTTYQLAKLQKGETDGLILGRYKLLYRNASGSFARVFRACSLDDGKMIGLKVLRQHGLLIRTTSSSSIARPRFASGFGTRTSSRFTTWARTTVSTI